jgi:hypothetical protein
MTGDTAAVGDKKKWQYYAGRVFDGTKNYVYMIFLCAEGPRSRSYRRTAALRLHV